MKKYIVKGNGLAYYGVYEASQPLDRVAVVGGLLTNNAFLYAQPFVTLVSFLTNLNRVLIQLPVEVYTSTLLLYRDFARFSFAKVVWGGSTIHLNLDGLTNFQRDLWHGFVCW